VVPLPLVVTVSRTRLISLACWGRFAASLGKAGRNQRGERGRAIGAKREEVGRRLVHVRREQLGRRNSLEGEPTRDQLKSQDAESVDVGAVIGVRVAQRLFRRHVGWRPDRHSGLGKRGALRVAVGARGADGLRDPEVGDGGAAAGKQDVVGLDVTVDDAVAMRVRQRARNVAQDADGFGEWNRSAIEPPTERVALDVRHREPGAPPSVSSDENRDDVGVLELRGEKHFAAEPLDRDAGQQVGRKHLHDDQAVQRMFTGDVGARHAAPRRARARRCIARRVQPPASPGGSPCKSGWSGSEGKITYGFMNCPRPTTSPLARTWVFIASLSAS
jgi:hypothetical protein